MDVTCDDCGSVQPAENGRCELCGASLEEEAERENRRSALSLLVAAVAATVFLCIGPGVIIHIAWFQTWSTGSFAMAYLGFWLVATLLAHKYEPRDDYEFGYFNNPFTLRDDIDRTHFTVGLILFPITIVNGLWVAAFRAVRG